MVSAFTNVLIRSWNVCVFPPLSLEKAYSLGLLPSDLQREPLAPSLLLVLKWGGELTPDGRVQAEELGRAFRCMYPGGQGKSWTMKLGKAGIR